MNATQSRPNRPLVWIAVGLLLAVAGCITIPLGDPEKSKVDDKLVGIWMSKPQDDGTQTMYTVTAYDSRTYFVSDFEYTKNNDALTAKGRMDWKMWLTDVGGQRFATLQMITPQLLLDDPNSKDNNEKYAIVKLTLDGDQLTVQAVNDDFIKSSNVQNSKELENFIAKNLNNSQLFNSDSEVETRVKDDQKDATAVLSAFGQGK